MARKHPGDPKSYGRVVCDNLSKPVHVEQLNIFQRRYTRRSFSLCSPPHFCHPLHTTHLHHHAPQHAPRSSPPSPDPSPPTIPRRRPRPLHPLPPLHPTHPRAAPPNPAPPPLARAPHTPRRRRQAQGPPLAERAARGGAIRERTLDARRRDRVGQGRPQGGRARRVDARAGWVEYRGGGWQRRREVGGRRLPPRGPAPLTW